MADFPLEDEATKMILGVSEDKSTDEKLGNIHCKSKCCANYERFATILNFVESTNKNWRRLNAKYIFARRSGLNFLKMAETLQLNARTVF